MKYMLVSLALFAASAPVLAAQKPVNITRFEYGAQWAFTKEEVTIECRRGNALFVLNNSTLMQYPLNDIAEQQVKTQQLRAEPLDTILLDDSKNPGHKMSIAPFQQRAEQLCTG